MPDRGLLQPGAIGDATFDADSSLVFEGARWLQITFEIDRAAALAAMPCEVGRPIPPYGRLLVVEAGEQRLALLSVGGRYRMMPRNVVVQVVGDGLLSPAAGTFGHGTVAGEVRIERSGAVVSAHVADASGPLASVTLPAIYAIEPGMLRWDGMVALGRDSGGTVIAELAPAAEITNAFLSKGAVVEMATSLPREHPWRRLRSLTTISACYAEGTFKFGAPAVQQTWG